ncbi:hypothetical protein ILYODFUR_038116 [Ilyodon furcidens]|uniref:Uncharacterized protein n=1 Tax=Ilyodon furcidens TaxID=33524 RepID=A0ABV0VKI9_9TELE
MRGTRRGYGKRLLVGLKEVLDAVQQVRKGKCGPSQALCAFRRELQTWTVDIVGRWKEDFLNPVTMSSIEEAEPEDSGQCDSLNVPIHTWHHVARELFNYYFQPIIFTLLS